MSELLCRQNSGLLLTSSSGLLRTTRTRSRGYSTRLTLVLSSEGCFVHPRFLTISLGYHIHLPTHSRKHHESYCKQSYCPTTAPYTYSAAPLSQNCTDLLRVPACRRPTALGRDTTHFFPGDQRCRPRVYNCWVVMHSNVHRHDERDNSRTLEMKPSYDITTG